MNSEDVGILVPIVLAALIKLGVSIFGLLLILKLFTDLNITWGNVFIPLWFCIPGLALDLIALIGHLLFSKVPDFNLDRDKVRAKIKEQEKFNKR